MKDKLRSINDHEYLIKSESSLKETSDRWLKLKLSCLIFEYGSVAHKDSSSICLIWLNDKSNLYKQSDS